MALDGTLGHEQAAGDAAVAAALGHARQDLGRWHWDANLNATWLGANDPGTARTQVGMSASFSTALSEQWGITGELSGTHRGGVANTAQVLGALTYSPSKRLTFDIGFTRAFQPTPGITSFFGCRHSGLPGCCRP